MKVNIYFPDFIIQAINQAVGSDPRHPIKNFIIVEDSVSSVHQPNVLTSEWTNKRGRKTNAKRIQVGKTWIKEQIELLRIDVNTKINYIIDDIVEMAERRS